MASFQHNNEYDEYDMMTTVQCVMDGTGCSYQESRKLLMDWGIPSYNHEGVMQRVLSAEEQQTIIANMECVGNDEHDG